MIQTPYAEEQGQQGERGVLNNRPAGYKVYGAGMYRVHTEEHRHRRRRPGGMQRIGKYTHSPKHAVHQGEGQQRIDCMQDQIDRMECARKGFAVRLFSGDHVVKRKTCP